MGRFKCFVDEGAALEHPAVLKRHRLGRTQSRTGDRDLRPGGDELRRLAELVRRPRRHLSSEEKDLLFRFRHSLTDQPGALTKFLHAVDWRDMEERERLLVYLILLFCKEGYMYQFKLIASIQYGCIM